MKSFKEFLIEASSGKNIYQEYEKWVASEGHLTGSSSSVLDEFSKIKKLSKDQHNELVRKVFKNPSDINNSLKK